jgi:small GTP-binding protein
VSLGPPGSKMFKIVLIGDGAVGKTSLRQRYLGEGFVTSHMATLGVDFAQKRFELNGVQVRLIIWDLAGQPSYEKVRRHYYLGCSGIVLVYSVVDRKSFDNASKWLVEAYKYMGQLPPTAVLANKTDLRASGSQETTVTTEEGKRFAEYFSEKLSVPVVFEETSALKGENIIEAFTELTHLMVTADNKTRLQDEPSRPDE